MNNVKVDIFNKIKKYDDIIIVRHIRPDGDCVGGSLGLRALLKESFPKKNIRVIANDYASYLAFLGKEDDEVDVSVYGKSLIIVVDTATKDRISNSNFEKGKEIIKIDHHIETDPYGDINWVEDYRSSLCEMIVDFYLTFKNELILNKEASNCLYAGIVSDSGRFKFQSVTKETLNLAGVLLETGIDTETLYANLYLKDFASIQLEGEVLKKAKITKNGVAYIYVDKAMQNKYNLSSADASAMISCIENIKGSIIWIAFIDNDDASIRVRLRSRFVTIDKLANKYHGGGHDRASGATVYSLNEMKQLLKDADALIKSFKESNSNWL